jgi:hypothetical protein
MSSPSPLPDVPLACPETSIQERFRRLADEWTEQSRYLSNTTKLAMLKSYQRILHLPVVERPVDPGGQPGLRGVEGRCLRCQQVE